MLTIRSTTSCLAASLVLTALSLNITAAPNHDSFADSVCREHGQDGFRVSECLDILSPALSEKNIVLDDAFIVQLANGLLWDQVLLREVLDSGITQGIYTRTAYIEDKQWILGEHSFTIDSNITNQKIHVIIELEGHSVATAELFVDYSSGSGDGFISFRALDANDTTIFIRDGQMSLAESSEYNTAASYYMGCFIDTTGFDTYKANRCGLGGSTPSTASFKVFSPSTPDSVIWTLPSSSCSGLFCDAPISPGESISGYAYLVINGTPIGPVSATANYFAL